MPLVPNIGPPPANVPTGQATAPFLVADDGTLTTAYENAGIVNNSPTTAAKREISNETPWAGPAPRALRKLTHFRAPGMGDAMWSGACTYDLAGASPSFSYYDDPDVYVRDDGLEYRIQNGLEVSRERVPVDAPTLTRHSRVAAHQDSAPASAFFQGFANLHWSGLLVGWVKTTPRPLHANFNPNAMGSKELHKATEYKPVPPMGSIVGYFGTEKAL